MALLNARLFQRFKHLVRIAWVRILHGRILKCRETVLGFGSNFGSGAKGSLKWNCGRQRIRGLNEREERRVFLRLRAQGKFSKKDSV